MLCLIPKVFLLKTLWRVEHVLICLKCRTIDLVRHGWDFPLLNFFTFKIFLLSKTLLPLIMFLLLLNVKIGGSAKNSFSFDSVCKMCQFLSNIYIYIYIYILIKSFCSKLFTCSFLFLLVVKDVLGSSQICLKKSRFLKFLWEFCAKHNFSES